MKSLKIATWVFASMLLAVTAVSAEFAWSKSKLDRAYASNRQATELYKASLKANIELAIHVQSSVGEILEDLH